MIEDLVKVELDVEQIQGEIRAYVQSNLADILWDEAREEVIRLVRQELRGNQQLHSQIQGVAQGFASIAVESLTKAPLPD